ncbi:ABC transporter ATP-binding protein [Desulfosediminicola flagellatus]|uniref:ABC transporter ATP-binding protein n=1 Tax=Desulfosediminicola flagellatus TaxID=2569541 RepID=UPI0010AC69E1|nr:ABC transporter ATP-binding protein [Desulfosediminicola flagellatus]
MAEKSLPPRIRLEKICKSFGEVHANLNVDLEIIPGRVLALLGENGAGKSTLMSILAGQLQPTSGTIYLDDRQTVFTSTDSALMAGVGMVYQHAQLVEAMTVAENIFLGRKGGFWVRKKTMLTNVQNLALQYGIEVEPSAKICELSIGQKQQVEILKLLYSNSHILVFDEPSAVLGSEESQILFNTIRALANEGKGIVLISHKLDEVMAIADDIIILKDGEVVDRLASTDVASAADLAERMTGRKGRVQVDHQPSKPGQIILKITGLTGEKLNGVDLDLRKGEILALVGIAGSGQKNLVENICGLKKPQGGTLKILGRGWSEFYNSKSWYHDLSYIPEDRQGLATCPGLDLLDNFLLTTRDDFAKGPWLQKEKAREKMERLFADFDVRLPGDDALAKHLSGGNLQKMVLAREFFRKPKLIVAEQPTQGLDVSAAEDVRNLLLKAREQAGILLVTGDLNEALLLADRIAVMYDGRIVECFQRGESDKVAAIPCMMAGISS